MVAISSKLEGASEDCIFPDMDITSHWEDSGSEKLKNPRATLPCDRKSVGEKILQINREKQRILTEANLEKDRRLDILEKEFNDHAIQHKEGIYWLRLQLETTRREKKFSDERMAEFQNQLRRLNLEQPACNVSLDPTITDSVGEDEEKDKLIAQLQRRVEKYEASFGMMENQIAMIQSSSGDIIKTLKEEIASLMEDRTRTELDLLNQLSELDNESRRRQLEHTLEIHNKDETIEALQNLERCSISVNGQEASSTCTLIWNGSESTEDSKSHILGCEILSTEQENDLRTTESRVGKDEPTILLLEQENTELQQKLEEANKSLDDLKSRLAKDSIMKIDLKIRHEIESLVRNALKKGTQHQEMANGRGVTIDTKHIHNNTLMELRKAEDEISRQIKHLENRKSFEKPMLVNVPHEHTKERAIEYKSKSRERIHHPKMDEMSSSPKLNLDAKDLQAARGDGFIISRDILYGLEKELIQYAERMIAKNQKIASLQEEVERYKIRESDPQNIFRASIELNPCTNRNATKATNDKSIKIQNAANDVCEQNEKKGKDWTCGGDDNLFLQKIPREILARKKGRRITTPMICPESLLTGGKNLNTGFEAKSSRGRIGMPVHSVLPNHRRSTEENISMLVTKTIPNTESSTTKLTKDSVRRLQPTPREVKKLLFLPPCFFRDESNITTFGM